MSPAAGIVDVCAALGDPTRWQVLERLGSGPASASRLATELPVTRQAIARHLEVLADCGLVERERVGREVRYRVVGSALTTAARRLDAMAEAWDRRLERLRDLAERE
ncbi:ArsR family transcriptional regulator [Aeromicrobium phragmitis]|uniref:ArsR family transcriptional regulator n=1 Tax=Aeromicrobium phragmitis TaxID=2478914 RepID=A0A3L8PIA8_9ACTN|nr:metalloregulator ArsR/SmtB family transcription factor [Aeromicrobium phragmitis]RLV54904.1 ArsR family transcriptional regulator [Aeromicrobium phragmitis]